MPTTTAMKEAIEGLYPPLSSASRRRLRRSGSSSLGSRASTRGSFNNLQFETNNNTTSSSTYNTSPKKRIGSKNSRFSELLLDHGEKDLHQDWAVYASSSKLNIIGSDENGNGNSNGISPSFQMLKIEGRLRLCSQSLVLIPHQTSRGIVRIPFRHMTHLSGGELNSEVIIRCDRHIVMKTNNVIGPFDYQQVPVEFRFQFIHSSPSSMLSMAKKLFDVESSSSTSNKVSFAPSVAFDMSMPPIIPLPSSNNVNDTRDKIIEQILGPNKPFDTTNFLHVHEKPLTPNLQCSIKTPLLEQSGCAIMTEYGLYFQPSISSGNNHVWAFEDMRAIARRYDGMKDTGLELYVVKQHSILLTFESTVIRERVIRILTQQLSLKSSLPLPCFTDRSFVESALELWQAGELDNFEYLLCLNSAAGRSFHDLSRYPVFPWVLASYGEGNHDSDDDALDDLPSSRLDLTDPSIFRDLSKPIGALNEERYEEFRKRYDSMVEQQKSQMSPQQSQDAPFMYGTHYSAPGYVLFYLLRVMPEHMLCLQSGKFDVPDRLFHSIDATYRSVLINNADVKEQIAEFYDPDCFDFLINSTGLQMGNLQTGERVNDVILPSRSKSAKHFIRQNRAALESEYCTEKLPLWIDLIFGVTSRGKNAKEAKNIFHPMSYITPKDLEGVSSDERARAELQSSEFGITPDQLFCKKHPGKKESIGNTDVMTRDSLRDSYGLEDNNRGFSSISLNQAIMSNDNLEHLSNPFD